MSDEFEMFDQPDDFLPGSVGEPGNRVFYMQARDGHRVTSLRCEKEQVLALAQFLMRLVGDDGPVEPPPAASPSGPDGSWREADRSASCAGVRSTPMGTPALD